MITIIGTALIYVLGAVLAIVVLGLAAIGFMFVANFKD